MHFTSISEFDKVQCGFIILYIKYSALLCTICGSVMILNQEVTIRHVTIFNTTFGSTFPPNDPPIKGLGFVCVNTGFSRFFL
jgi:hypothetical protein